MKMIMLFLYRFMAIFIYKMMDHFMDMHMHLKEIYY